MCVCVCERERERVPESPEAWTENFLGDLNLAKE